MRPRRHSLGQDTTHRRDAAGEPVLLLQEDVQAKFAAKGIAASQLPDVVFVSVGPLMGADPAGTARASDEAGQAGSVQSLPPPVVGGSGAGDRLQCQLLGTALAAEPVVEAEFLPALDGLLGSRVVNGQPAVEWVGQSFDLHASGPPCCCSHQGYLKRPRRGSPERRRGSGNLVRATPCLCFRTATSWPQFRGCAPLLSSQASSSN